MAPQCGVGVAVSSVSPSSWSRLPATSSATLRSAVELTLVLLLAVQAARLTWVLLAPLPPAPQPRPDAIASTPAPPVTTDFFFRDAGGIVPPPGAASALYTVYSVRTGVLAGSAILAGADGLQVAYRIGDVLPDGSVLESVQATGVVVRSGATRREIALAEGPPGAVPAVATTLSGAGLPGANPSGAILPGAIPAASTAIDAKQLLQQIGLRPHTDGGRVSGYELQSRGDGALMRQAGLQAGDILQAVDGNALTPERLGELEQTLTTRGSVALTVLRDGQPRTINLQTRLP